MIKSREEIQNFNPRLREGGDDSLKIGADGKLISIHASAKEATPLTLAGNFRGWRISIHASAKEATRERVTTAAAATDFNPRLREGGDPRHLYVCQSGGISIHASAKEATWRFLADV